MMTCGTCKYWLKGSVYSHGSYIYGHCCNKESEFHNNIKEYDNSCSNHSHKKLMEKRAVVKEDEKVSTITKEAMEKLLEAEKKKEEKLYVLGADPGKHGGIALINVKDLSDVILIPTKVKDGRVWAEHLYESLLPFIDNIVVAVKEEIHAIFGSSASSTFEFGAADGILEALLRMIAYMSKSKFPVYTVQPKMWQAVAWKGVDLVKGDPIMDKVTKKQKITKKGEPRFKTDTKATSMEAAHAIFPKVNFIPPRCRNEHDGLIDAALIAYWGLKKHVK